MVTRGGNPGTANPGTADGTYPRLRGANTAPSVLLSLREIVAFLAGAIELDTRNQLKGSSIHLPAVPREAPY